MHLLQLEEVLEKTAALQAANDLGKILAHKWHDHIAGGLADKRSPADFPRDQLLKGMVVEMEHTNDPSVACEIAMDHLVEDEHYYNHEQDMAKEVEEKIGHVMPREDGAIKVARALGIKLAGMNKEAWNPLALVKRVGSGLAGKVAPRALEAGAAKAVAHGAEGAIAHGAEGAMGKVLPFQGAASHMGTVGGHAQQGISGLERTNLDLHPAGAVPSTNTATMRPGAKPRPVGQVQPAVPIQQAVHQAVQPVGERASTTAYNAHLANQLQAPLGEGRRIGADEWIKANPEQAAANRRAAPTPLRSGASPVGQVASRPAPSSREDAVIGKLQARGSMSPAVPARTNYAPQTAHSVQGNIPEAAMNLKGPERTMMGATPAAGPATPGAVQPNSAVAGGGASTAGAPPAGGPPTAPPTGPGSVETNPATSPGPDKKRFGWGGALLGAGVLGGGYAAMKGVPWAANKLEQTSAMPLAYGGGWSSTPYGYGYNPYGNGTPSMGASA